MCEQNTPQNTQANALPAFSMTVLDSRGIPVGIGSASCYTFEDFVSDVSGITPSEEGMDAVNRLADTGGFESTDVQSAIAQAWDTKDWEYAS